jgi:hypothetical protein
MRNKLLTGDTAFFFTSILAGTWAGAGLGGPWGAVVGFIVGTGGALATPFIPRTVRDPVTDVLQNLPRAEAEEGLMQDHLNILRMLPNYWKTRELTAKELKTLDWKIDETHKPLGQLVGVLLGVYQRNLIQWMSDPSNHGAQKKVRAAVAHLDRVFRTQAAEFRVWSNIRYGAAAQARFKAEAELNERTRSELMRDLAPDPILAELSGPTAAQKSGQRALYVANPLVQYGFSYGRLALISHQLEIQELEAREIN